LTLPKEERFAPRCQLGSVLRRALVLSFEYVTARGLEALRTNFGGTGLTQRSMPRWHLFGGGHVGKALVQVLGTFASSTSGGSTAATKFSRRMSPPKWRCEHSDPVQAAVTDLVPSESRVLIMSFSHAEDLDIVAACLQRIASAATTCPSSA
jgi:xanthine dehydrogenase accessory factor